MQSKIDLARKRAEQYLLSLQVRPGVFDFSKHNGGREAGMLLPGTYDAVNALALMKRLDASWTSDSIAFLQSFRRRDGFFRMPGMKKDELTYPSFEYDNLHITNYAMSALDSLGWHPQANELRFVKRYIGKRLEKWLKKRDLAKPWSEGNYLVNVASFLIEGTLVDVPRCNEGVRTILQWHSEVQDEFGFFHDTAIEDLTNAFAGAAHNFHLYYYFHLPVPQYRAVVDYMLTRPTAADSACIDVDEMDILFHFSAFGYRVPEIHSWAERKLESILALQREDGGFPDALYGELTFDGWKKYREPQGASNAFAAWFRLIAIGMADTMLYGRGESWTFRRTIGIGYANPDYLKGGYSEEALLAQEAEVLHRAEKKREERKNDPVFQNLQDARVADLVAVFTKKMETCDKALLNYNARFTFVILNEGAFGIAISDGTATVTGGVLPASQLTVITDRKTLGKLMAKKLDSKMAYALGKIKIRGNISLALKLGGLL